DPDEDGNPPYFAHFPLEFNTPEIEGTELILSLGEGEEATEHVLKVTEDFVFVPRGIAAGEIEAPIVFLGYGRAGAGDDPNDFDAIDVEGKVVLVLDGLPEGEEQEEEQPSRRGPRGGAGSSFTKLQEARERGALAVIVVHAFDAEDSPTFSDSNPFAARMFGRKS